jgi:hypothetical protein
MCVAFLNMAMLDFLVCSDGGNRFDLTSLSDTRAYSIVYRYTMYTHTFLFLELLQFPTMGTVNVNTSLW